MVEIEIIKTWLKSLVSQKDRDIYNTMNPQQKKLIKWAMRYGQIKGDI